MNLNKLYPFLTFLIPVAHAIFTVKILAFNTIHDSVEVRGKESSDGDIRTLGVDGEESDIKSYCFMDETYIGWTTNCVGSKPTFSEVTTIIFDEPTTAPRQLNISTPQHELMCYVTVTEESGFVNWFLDWGLAPDHSPIDIICISTT